MRDRDITLAIHTPNDERIVELYDSRCEFRGQAANLKISYNESELTQMQFDIPRMIVNDEGSIEDNPRWEFAKAEYKVYYTEDGKTDVFVIKNVEEAIQGEKISASVECIHVAEQLKARGYSVSFENKVGTAEEILDSTMEHTGWTVGTVETLNEKTIFNRYETLTGGTDYVPDDIGVTCYMELNGATGATQWSSTDGWQDASYRIVTQGKNLCNGLIERGKLNDVDGTPDYTVTSTAYRSIDYMSAETLATLAVTVSGENVGGAKWWFFNANKVKIGSSTGLAVTVPSGTRYVKYELWKNSAGTETFVTAPRDVQIEIGSTASEYESYAVPFIIETGRVGQYDIVTRDRIERYTIYDEDTHTAVQSEELLKVDSLAIYNAKFYIGGTVYSENNGVGATSIPIAYTTEIEEDSYPRVKYRTLTKDSGSSAYDTIRDIETTFDCYAVFDGLNKTVSLVNAIGEDNGVQFNVGYNMNWIKRKRSSNELITRLYASESEFSIGKVNPTGMNYLLSFSYFDETGALTDEQRAAIEDFNTNVPEAAYRLRVLMDKRDGIGYDVNSLVGQTPLALAEVSNVTSSTVKIGVPTYYNGGVMPTSGDTLWLRESNGVWSEHSVVAYSAGTNTATLTGTLSSGTYAVWYKGAVPGIIGARLITLETKQENVNLLQSQYDATPDTDPEEKAALLERLNEAKLALVQLSNGTTEVAGLNQMIAQLLQQVTMFNEANANIAAEQATIDSETDALENALGGMIREGMYGDGEYIAGQEAALYQDMGEYLSEHCVPQVEYSVDALDRGLLEGYELERVRFGDTVYVSEPRANIYNLKAQVTSYVDMPQKNACASFDIGNFAREAENLFQDIVDGAKLIKAKRAQIENAVTLTPDGRIDTEIMNLSLVPSNAAQIVDKQNDDYNADNGVSEDESFEAQVAKLFQSNLTTAAMNAAVIDWTNIPSMIFEVNKIVTQVADTWEAKAVRVGGGEEQSVAVDITPDRFSVSVNGGEQLGIDNTGVTAEVISSPSVVKRYNGPDPVIIVDSTATGSQYVSGLSDACELLNGKYIDHNITILINEDQYGDFSFSNVGGTGGLQISIADNVTVHGQILFEHCDCNLQLVLKNITNANAEAVVLKYCPNMGNALLNSNVTTSNTTAINVNYGSFLEITGSTLVTNQYNGTVAIAQNSSRIVMRDCVGKGAVTADNGAILQLNGTVPVGNRTHAHGSIFFEESVTPTSAGGDTPVVTNTITLTAQTSVSAYGSSGGNRTTSWSENQTSMFQGYSSNFRQMSGMVWFDMDTLRQTLANKTVKSARLTMRRVPVMGGTHAIVPTLRLMTLLDSYATSGNVTPGTGFVTGDAYKQDLSSALREQSLDATLTDAITQALKTNGDVTGFMLYNGETSVYSSNTFSRNFGGFYGVGSAYVPTLTVVYEG